MSIEDEAREAAEKHRESTGWTMAEGHDIAEAFEKGYIAGAARQVKPAEPEFPPPPVTDEAAFYHVGEAHQ